MRAIRSIVWVFALLLVTAGCGKKQSAETAEDTTERARAGKTWRIAVIPKGTSHVFWQSVHAGAAKAGHDLGVEIIWQGPATEGEREAQFKIVEDMISRKVDAIVLAPLDAKALVPAILEADKAGIPVVIIDSAADTDKYVSFVATDNYLGGVKAAETLAKLLDGKGRVILVRYNPGSASTTKREKGFEETLQKQYQTTVATALSVVEDMLSRVQEFEGIFACNESTAVGALRALENHKLAGKVRFVAFDASPTLVQGLKEHKIDALIAQNPFKMGYEGVKAAFEHLTGAQVPKRIDTGVTVITMENLSKPEIQELVDVERVKKWLRR